MSDALDKRRSVRRQRSIYQVHYDIKRREEMTARPIAKRAGSPEVTAYHQQVAGHRTSNNAKYLGLLQCSNGTILKPIIKEPQKREVAFYSRLASATEPDLVELRRLVPRYFGTTRYCYGGHTQEYIMMEDLALRMMEPCIMDVKIGRRTWDPLASEEKIKNEESKYSLCKQEYAFCIPGYQVYRPGGRRAHYNKEHGKRLHGPAVQDAIRNYLNGSPVLCRALVLQLLAQLWRLQTWARHQTRLRLYGASLLLIYDAARLRDWCANTEHIPRIECRATPIPRRRSIHSMHSVSSFSGQLTAKGPHYKKVNSVPITSMSVVQQTFAPHPPNSTWGETWEKLNHNHSFDHNYEDKLSKIKMNYKAMLDQLSYDSPSPNPWGAVKIIDFAHAFFNEEEESAVDNNFREGIESLVEIFESFLRETNDQVI